MKKKILIICTVLSIVFNFFFFGIIGVIGYNWGFGEVVTTISGSLSLSKEFEPATYWKDKVSQFKILNKELEKGQIVFLGDSITDRFRVNEFFPDYNIVNRGIDADLTEGIIRRLDETVLNLRPAKVFIMIGTNDIYRGLSKEEIVDNYQIIIDRIKEKSPSTQIFIQSILSTGKVEQYRDNKLIEEINKELKTIANQENLKYIELSTLFTDEQGYLAAKYSEDGLHLKGNAYQLWANDINKYLKYR